jgi:uncharacterized membrane protein YfcA
MISLSTVNLLWLPLLGVVAGLISGALGVGSGILLIPALVLLLGMTQKSAQGTSLAVMVAMAAVGAFRYYTNQEIQMSLTTIVILSIAAVVGAYLGSHLAFMLSGAVLRKMFAVFIMLVGMRMFFE